MPCKTLQFIFGSLNWSFTLFSSRTIILHFICNQVPSSNFLIAWDYYNLHNYWMICFDLVYWLSFLHPFLIYWRWFCQKLLIQCHLFLPLSLYISNFSESFLLVAFCFLLHSRWHSCLHFFRFFNTLVSLISTPSLLLIFILIFTHPFYFSLIRFR